MDDELFNLRSLRELQDAFGALHEQDRLSSLLIPNPSFRNAIDPGPDILRRAKKARLGVAAHAGKAGPLLELAFADSAHADLSVFPATR